MKRALCTAAILSCAGLAFSARGQGVDVQINEIATDVPGVDNGAEFFELKGPPGTSLNGMTLVVIEAEGTVIRGTIDQAISLNGVSLGANGLFLHRDTATVLVPPPAGGTNVRVGDFVPDIENGGQTYLLVIGFTGAVGNDLDTNDDGTLDLTPWGAVIDAISISANTPNPVSPSYSDDFGFPFFPQSAFIADWLGRAECGRWIAADTVGGAPGPFTFDPLESIFTDGTAADLTGRQVTAGSENGISCPAAGMTITGVDRTVLVDGEFVQIFGSGFGDNPDNLCVVISNGDRLIPLRAFEANDNRILAQLGAVPPDAVPGAIMVALGEGREGVLTPGIDGIIYECPDQVPWSWENVGLAQDFVMDTGPVIAVFPNPAARCVHGDANIQNNSICLTLSGDCKPNQNCTIYFRIHGSTSDPVNPLFGFYDQHIRCTRFRAGGNALRCAEEYCDLIREFFSDNNLEDVLTCTVVSTGANTVKMTLQFSDPALTTIGGTLSICCDNPEMGMLDDGTLVTGYFDARPLTDGDMVRVENIGSTGQDGVTVELPAGTDSVSIAVSRLELEAPGAEIHMRGWGDWSDEERASLGVAGIRKVDNFFDIFADYSDIESPDVRTQVYRDGVMVAEATSGNGVVGRLLSPAVVVTTVGKVGVNPVGPLPWPCHVITFRGALPFQLSNGAMAMGDELRVLATSSPFPIVELRQFDIGVGNIIGNSFEITASNPQGTPPCPWTANGCFPDYDASGGIDGDDVIAFFADWDNNAQCADVNQDGGVDGDDVINFFASWDAGGAGQPGC